MAERLDRVKITYFENPYNFWFVRIGEIDKEYEFFNKKIQEYCAKAKPFKPRIGEVFAVHDADSNRWVRAEIDRQRDVDIACTISESACFNPQIKRDGTPSTYHCWYVDEGKLVSTSNGPRELSTILQEKEPRVEKGVLHGLIPLSKIVDERVNLYSKRSDHWTAASTTIITRALVNPKYTVFFESRHQFENVISGNLFLANSDEKNHLVNIADVLIYHQLAERDERAFLKDSHKFTSLRQFRSPYYTVSQPNSRNSSEEKFDTNKSLEKMCEEVSKMFVKKPRIPACMSPLSDFDIDQVSVGRGTTKRYSGKMAAVCQENKVSSSQDKAGTHGRNLSTASSENDNSDEAVRKRRSIGRGKHKSTVTRMHSDHNKNVSTLSHEKGCFKDAEENSSAMKRVKTPVSNIDLIEGGSKKISVGRGKLLDMLRSKSRSVAVSENSSSEIDKKAIEKLRSKAQEPKCSSDRDFFFFENRKPRSDLFESDSADASVELDTSTESNSPQKKKKSFVPHKKSTILKLIKSKDNLQLKSNNNDYKKDDSMKSFINKNQNELQETSTHDSTKFLKSNQNKKNINLKEIITGKESRQSEKTVILKEDETLNPNLKNGSSVSLKDKEQEKLQEVASRDSSRIAVPKNEIINGNSTEKRIRKSQDGNNVGVKKPIKMDISGITLNDTQLENDDDFLARMKQKQESAKAAVLLNNAKLENEDEFLQRMKRKKEEKEAAERNLLVLLKSTAQTNKNELNIENVAETDDDWGLSEVKMPIRKKDTFANDSSSSDYLSVVRYPDDDLLDSLSQSLSTVRVTGGETTDCTTDEEMSACNKSGSLNDVKTNKSEKIARNSPNNTQKKHEKEDNQNETEKNINWPQEKGNVKSKSPALKILPSGGESSFHSRKKHVEQPNSDQRHVKKDPSEFNKFRPNDNREPLKQRISNTRQTTYEYGNPKEMLMELTPKLLVNSCVRVNKLQSFFNGPLSEDIYRILETMQVTELTAVWSIAWPSIARGHNIVCIESRMHSSPYLNRESSLSYMPVLCNAIITGEFRDVGNGCGPIALIVCASKTAARLVYDVAIHILQVCAENHRPKLSLLLNKVETDRNRALDYCDILVTTPCCFTRRSEMGGRSSRITDLKRLCFFVLDECDILMETYNKQIDFITHKCSNMLKKRSQEKTGRNVQIIVAAQSWSMGIENICKRMPVPPVICIRQYIEAAFYSRAKIQLHFLEDNSKPKAVLDLISVDYKRFKTLIVCNKRQEVVTLREFLFHGGISVEYLHNQCTGEEIQCVKRAWHSPACGDFKALICTDELLTDINISDASWLIHYALSPTWTHFTKRFSCLNDNYQSPFTPENKTPRCNVHIFVDEQNEKQIPRMIGLLKRMNVDIPHHLMKTSEKIMQRREIEKAEKGILLCNSLLSWGECLFGFECQSRHSMFKHVDEPVIDIAINCEVKLRLLTVHDVTHFSARLLNVADQFPMISAQMSQYYSKPRAAVRELISSKKYAVERNIGLYQRCEILEVSESSRTKKCLVQLLDTGEKLTIDHRKLFELPNELLKIPAQAVQVYVSNLKPADGERSWDSKGKDLVNEMLTRAGAFESNSYMHGRVSFVLGRAIWIDRVNVYEKLEAAKIVTKKLALKMELVKQQLAETNENHLTCLKQLSTKADITLKTIKIEKIEKVLPKTTYNVQNAHMDIDENFEKVIVLNVSEEEKIYLGLGKFNDLLNQLLNEIKTAVSKDLYPTTVDVSVGKYCLAYMSNEDYYYRAKIINVEETQNIECWLLDEGYAKSFTINDLRPIKKYMFDKLPCQTITCRLWGIKKCNIEQLLQYEGSEVWGRCLQRDSDGTHVVLLADMTENGNIPINLRLLESVGTKSLPRETLSEDMFVLINDPPTEIVDDIESDEVNENEINNSLTSALEEELNFDESEGSTHENSFDFSKFDIHIDDPIAFYYGRPSTKGKFPELQQKPFSECTNKTINSDSDDPGPPVEGTVVSSMRIKDSLTPTVKWYQTEKLVVLKIQLIDVQHKSLEVDSQTLYFSTTIDNKFYVLDLDLYGIVDKDNFKCREGGQELVIKLTKIEPVEWPRLLQTKQRLCYIKADLDHLLQQQVDSDDEGKPRLPFENIGKLLADYENSDSDINYEYGSEIEENSSDFMSDDAADKV